MPYIEASARHRQLVAAARIALAREGVGNTSLRAVAAEAGVPLGTMQYVFPSKELLLRAVLEDVIEETAEVFRAAADLDGGLEHALRRGIAEFWSRLVEGRGNMQVIQHELTYHALRSAGMEGLARWQYERYGAVVADWCQQAAQRAGESCAVPFAQLARLVVANLDGLVMQYVSDPHPARSRQDLEAVTEMLVALAGVRGDGVVAADRAGRPYGKKR
ncbi:TetR/AcrR family transcriptional regulator [Streptomyces albidoflavus]|uniref:TetR/AcrR family transcriptional regulator n=1 Tax=Streptomyces albidoflavus TaxID=1886 RepID=UPI000249417A|nr:TetR/AcrR family transcriptional regulator [Streptomyces albidoflavus]RZD89982.1 TetR/AcrR family transcriptional regulator [Streptomyces albidoflavus]RZD93568.1 TetR/AcrR family transcriptional regulator [Streptomyces albidoflavus]